MNAGRVPKKSIGSWDIIYVVYVYIYIFIQYIWKQMLIFTSDEWSGTENLDKYTTWLWRVYITHLQLTWDHFSRIFPKKGVSIALAFFCLHQYNNCVLFIYNAWCFSRLPVAVSEVPPKRNPWDLRQNPRPGSLFVLQNAGNISAESILGLPGRVEVGEGWGLWLGSDNGAFWDNPEMGTQKAFQNGEFEDQMH